MSTLCDDCAKTSANRPSCPITSTECNNIQNNKGLDSTDNKDNCADFNTIIQQLWIDQADMIADGNLCNVPYNDDSKASPNGLPTLYSIMTDLKRTFQFLRCDMCGQWTKINDLQKQIDTLKDLIEQLKCQQHRGGKVYTELDFTSIPAGGSRLLFNVNIADPGWPYYLDISIHNNSFLQSTSRYFAILHQLREIGSTENWLESAAWHPSSVASDPEWRTANNNRAVLATSGATNLNFYLVNLSSSPETIGTNSHVDYTLYRRC